MTRRPTPISSSLALAVVPLFAAVASEVAVVSHSSSFAWAGEQPRPGLVIPAADIDDPPATRARFPVSYTHLTLPTTPYV